MSQITKNKKTKTSRSFTQQKVNKYTTNFLKSSSLILFIINNYTNLSKEDKVLEIGTGSVKITKVLAQKVAKVITVEKDRSLVNKFKQNLSAFSNINYIIKDFLDFDLNKIGNYKVFSNIPFAITSQIIKKLFFSKNPPIEAYLIVQKEAYLRMVGRDKDRTVFLPAKLIPFYDIQVIYRFVNEDFSPPPRVKCLMVKFNKVHNDLIQEFEKKKYWDFVDYLSMNYRGNIKSILKVVLTNNQIKKFISKYDLDANSRVHDFKVSMFVDLYRFFMDEQKSDKLLRGFEIFRNAR